MNVTLKNDKYMSNLIFCNVDNILCDKVKEIAGNRIVVDCGAGRGLFSSIYKGNAISIDIQQPDEPISPILDHNSELYCFPKGAIPIFIRPCHSNFVHNTIIHNRNKFDKAIYVSMPKNLDGDLETNGLFYRISQYSDWEGSEGERIYLVELNKPGEEYTYLSGRIIHLADPMLSCLCQTQEQEFRECVESPLEDMGILVDGLRLRLFDYYPTGESFDYMFFDYGGMSLGNSLMESLCRHITNEAEKYPSRSFIIVSTFTQYAMRDAINEFGRELPNVFLSLSDFVENYKRYGKF